MAAKRPKKRDYYAVLEITRTADEVEIKRSFRELARKVHPDMNQNPEAADRFKEINEAYAVLSDPTARARYDRFGFVGIGAMDNASPGEAVAQAFDDLLSDIWKRRKRKQRGRDLRYTLEISFEEAARGCQKTIVVEFGEPLRKREFVVQVPAGAKDGAIRTLRGEGEVGRDGGEAGDLNVVIRVREHAVFRRDGFDIVCEIPVTFPQAALGAIVDVPTLDGAVKMRIPPGTQSGRTFRIRERGIVRADKVRGDQRVRVVVEVPVGLSPRQRELLEEFAKESGEVLAHPQKQGFLDKLRDYL